MRYIGTSILRFNKDSQPLRLMTYTVFNRLYLSVQKVRYLEGERREKFKDRLFSKMAKETPDADYYFIKGLVAYRFNDPPHHIEREFSKALSLCPSFDFCKYFFSLFLIDQNRYKEALSLLSTINLEELNLKEQRWRSLKIEEFILVCRIKLAHSTLTIAQTNTEIYTWLQDFSQFIRKDENLSDWGFPSGLIYAMYLFLYENASHINTMRKTVALLLEIIEYTELHTFSDYHEEYQYLKNLSSGNL